MERSPYFCCGVLSVPYAVFYAWFQLLWRRLSSPVWDACHPLWASQLVRVLWPYVVVCWDVHRSHLWCSLFLGPYHIGFPILLCFCFYNTMFVSHAIICLNAFIDAVVLCVFCDSVLLLLYMCPFWIKRSGLVTPPGGAADPQFLMLKHIFFTRFTRRILLFFCSLKLLFWADFSLARMCQIRSVSSQDHDTQHCLKCDTLTDLATGLVGKAIIWNCRNLFLTSA